MAIVASMRTLKLVVLLAPLFYGSVAHQSSLLKAVAPTKLEFHLSGLDVRTVGDAALSVRVPGWPMLGVRNEPDLPVVRAALVLPHNLGTWKAVVRDVQKRVIPLEGRKVLPSAGPMSICASEAISPANTFGPAYQGVYPQSNVVSLGEPYTWRDVYGADLQILPVTVDHSVGTMEVLSSCTIELVSTESAPRAVAKKVDPDFHGAYSFVYANFEHYGDVFLRNDKLGRVLVVHEAQFKTHAQSYADWVKQQWSQDAIISEAGSSADDVKNTISQHYKEAAGLSYVMIIGRNVPTPHGSKTRKECDNCYAMLSGGVTLDLFVGRLSGATASDIDIQMAKIKGYNSSGTAAWNTRAYGSAAGNAPWFNAMFDNFGAMGFSEHKAAVQPSAQQNFAEMDKGLGIFAYAGHGSGTAWMTPHMTVRDIQARTNIGMPFFDIDLSCDNGGFQSHNPCLGEALLTAKGGAISTMMHAPEARGSTCHTYMTQVSEVLKSGKANRVGPVYSAALMAAQAKDPDDYTVQGYNVFGDPMLRLALPKLPQSPTPSSIVV